MTIKQTEMPFTPDCFNLAGESGEDGERVAREREASAQAREEADRMQMRICEATRQIGYREVEKNNHSANKTKGTQ